MSITSLVIGIVCALALFDDSAWDRDTAGGALLIAAAGIVLGGVSLNQRKAGKGMAIASIVMSGIGVLIALGKFPG